MVADMLTMQRSTSSAIREASQNGSSIVELCEYFKNK